MSLLTVWISTIFTSTNKIWIQSFFYHSEIGITTWSHPHNFRWIIHINLTWSRLPPKLSWWGEFGLLTEVFICYSFVLLRHFINLASLPKLTVSLLDWESNNLEALLSSIKSLSMSTSLIIMPRYIIQMTWIPYHQSSVTWEY